jgi:predicted nucleic-acid-binding protein
MKLSLLDTDILSEYLRGNPKVVAKISQYIEKYNMINISLHSTF